MSTVEQPGINAIWAKTRKSDYSPSQLKMDVENFERTVRDLEYYVQHGVMPPSQFASPDDPPRSWQGGGLSLKLKVWGKERSAVLERQSVMQGAPFDTESAVRIFAAVYTAEMISLAKAERMDISRVPFIALGAVIGCKNEAFRVARLLLLVYRKGRYAYDNLNTRYRPALHFIMRLLADYLGELPHVLQGESLTEPHYRALFDHWREPDVEALVPFCLAACDAHTHRNNQFDEFRTRTEWKRNPIEILLLFKLRELLGLANPMLDHPLMNTPLGKLPPEISFDAFTKGSDDLVYRVRQRMMQDGYDEEAIFARTAQELELE